MNKPAPSLPVAVGAVAVLEILLGIFIAAISLSVVSDDVARLWGTVLGVMMMIAGGGVARLLEWARALTVMVCFILGLGGIGYLFIMMNPLARSDRLYNNGPGDTVVYVVALVIIAAAYAGGRLLKKHKDKFR